MNVKKICVVWYPGYLLPTYQPINLYLQSFLSTIFSGTEPQDKQIVFLVRVWVKFLISWMKAFKNFICFPYTINLYLWWRIIFKTVWQDPAMWIPEKVVDAVMLLKELALYSRPLIDFPRTSARPLQWSPSLGWHPEIRERFSRRFLEGENRDA